MSGKKKNTTIVKRRKCKQAIKPRKIKLNLSQELHNKRPQRYFLDGLHNATKILIHGLHLHAHGKHKTKVANIIEGTSKLDLKLL